VLDVDAEGWVEDSWCGRSSVHIGTARLAPEQPCVRCTMVTRAQPDIAEDRDIFRTLARHHGATFGAWTVIAAAGRIAVGDAVRVEPLPSQA
jgi:uncharacterized protein YcbX